VVAATNANGIIDKLADGSAFVAQPAVNIGKSNNGVVILLPTPLILAELQL